MKMAVASLPGKTRKHWLESIEFFHSIWGFQNKFRRRRPQPSLFLDDNARAALSLSPWSLYTAEARGVEPEYAFSPIP